MKRKILSLVLSYSVLMGASLVYNDYKMKELDSIEADVDEIKVEEVVAKEEIKVEDKIEDVIIEDEVKEVEEVVVKEEPKKEKEVVVAKEVKKEEPKKEVVKEVKEEEIIIEEEEDRECEICKCYVRLSYITEDGICFECNEIKQSVVVECGVCANRFEQSEIDEHGMCSKCRSYYKQCELCGYYALDRDDNFNADGVCIVCLDPSLLEE